MARNHAVPAEQDLGERRFARPDRTDYRPGLALTDGPSHGSHSDFAAGPDGRHGIKGNEGIGAVGHGNDRRGAKKCPAGVSRCRPITETPQTGGTHVLFTPPGLRSTPRRNFFPTAARARQSLRAAAPANVGRSPVAGDVRRVGAYISGIIQFGAAQMANRLETIPDVLLMGPGPSSVFPEVYWALARPTLGHLDPAFIAIMDDTKTLLQQLMRTANAVTFPVSGTGSAGMEAAFVNLVEAGDRVLIL